MNPSPTPEPTPPDGQLRLYEGRYLGPLLGGLAFLKAATVVLYLALAIPLRFDISFPEGAVVARAFEGANGGQVYADWREWPHQFAPYGPLTYYPVAWAARITGRASHPMDLYALGRLQSFGAIVGILSLIALMIRRLGGGWVWGGLAACGFLAWRLEMEFAVSFRPDAPAVFLSLFAFFIALRSPPSGWRVLGALALLWLSFWYKATGFGMGAVLGFWLVRGYGWRRAAGVMIGFALAGIVPALILNRIMDGRLFLNLVTGLSNGIQLRNWADVMIPSPTIPSAIMIGGLVVSVVRVARSGLRDAELEDAGLLLVFAFATLQMFKIGANYNYYTEFYALACVVCARAGERIWHSAGWRRNAIVWAVATPLFLLDAQLGLGQAKSLIGTMIRAQGDRPLFKRVEKIDGPLLVQTADLALIRPSPPTVMDYVHYSLMVRRGFIDSTGLREKVAGRYFRGIVALTENLEAGRNGKPGDFLFSSPDWVKLIDANYIETGRIEPYSILEPRKP